MVDHQMNPLWLVVFENRIKWEPDYNFFLLSLLQMKNHIACNLFQDTEDL